MHSISGLAEKEVVLHAFGFLFYALLAVGLSLFLEKIQESGMVLGRYGLWITYQWRKAWRKKDRWKRYWLKPMGYCVYCFGTWVSIFTYVLLIKSSILLLPGFIGLWYLLLRLVQRLLSGPAQSPFPFLKSGFGYTIRPGVLKKKPEQLISTSISSIPTQEPICTSINELP